MTAQIEGNRLEATGYTTFSSDTVDVSLQFHNDCFTGTLKLPFGGDQILSGKQGRGISLSEQLIPLVEPYRKANVPERSDESISQEVEKLIAKMSLSDKIGQMSQILASDFSFGADVDAEPTEQVIAQGKAGSILGLLTADEYLICKRLRLKSRRLEFHLCLMRMLFMATRRYSRFLSHGPAAGTWNPSSWLVRLPPKKHLLPVRCTITGQWLMLHVIQDGEEW